MAGARQRISCKKVRSCTYRELFYKQGMKYIFKHSHVGIYMYMYISHSYTCFIQKGAQYVYPSIVCLKAN